MLGTTYYDIILQGFVRLSVSRAFQIQFSFFF